MMGKIRKYALLTAAVMLFAALFSGCAARESKVDGQPSEALDAAAAPTAAPTPAPTPKPTPTPTPTQATLKEGAQSPEVTKLQERLIKLDYLHADKATDYYGSATREAVETFQRQNGLDVTGIADAQTIELLNSGKAKACDTFLKLAPTVGMSFEELVMSDDGTRDEYPKGFPEAGTYKIIVDVEHQVTLVYTKDDDGDYTVPVRYMLCSTGKDGATPQGTFKMNKYHVRFSQFARDKTYGQYWTQIYGAFYFHTILYDKMDTGTYIEEVWEKMGTADSHGCVRLTVPDAKWMWYNIAPGTVCVIRAGDPNDEKTASIREQLELAPLPSERPDIDPENIPSTDNWSVEDVATDVPFVQGSQD
ncbi:peptidase [Christensenellaceae bacterium]|nr:peptidase [Christensenellaceae bacterium]BDF60471.1 peptidase [Christensenellaceae bacterium]